MASQTTLSESAVNKSVDEEVEGPLIEEIMDKVDVLKVGGDSAVLDSKDTEKLEEAAIPEIKENENPKEQTLGNEGLNEEKVADEADVSKTVDDSPVLDCKDTDIFKEDKTPEVMENEIPKGEATLNEGINIEKAQDEAEVSRPVDISSLSDSKDKDILKEEERIEVKEIEPPKEQQIVESATNENLEIPKIPEVEETNPPKNEGTESSMKEDSMKAQDAEIFKEDKTPAVMENEIPKEQATVNEGINIEKAQDESEISRPVDISSISDSKDKDILKEQERIAVKEIEPPKEQQIVESATNENLEIPKIPEVEETNPPKDEETEISMKEDSMKAQDTEIFKGDKTPAVMENKIPKEEATVNGGINIEKAQDEAEVSRPVDISFLSDSKDKDILKEKERIEVKEIEPPKEQQIVESATNENLEIPKAPEVEETNPPKDEETEISMKEDSFKAQECNTPKEVEGNEGAAEGSSKEEEIPVVSGERKQDTLEATEKENLKEEETTHLAEKEKSHEPEISKDQAMTEKANEEPLKVVEEDKVKNETFEPAEVDSEKKTTMAESREVQIPVVTGAESKTEDVPGVVVRKVVEKPAAHRSTHIFRNVGSKMMQMVQKMRNVITRKSSNGKVAK